MVAATLQPETRMPTARLSTPEALIYAMITVSAVDKRISNEELSRIGSIVRDLPAFEDRDEDWLTSTAQECGKLLSKPNGLDKVLDKVRDSLPDRLRETAYVLAAEVAAVDLKVEVEEVRFLEMLAEKLALDRLTCAALERAAKARHQKA
jgi:tellurite resistance protein